MLWLSPDPSRSGCPSGATIALGVICAILFILLVCAVAIAVWILISKLYYVLT